MATTVGEVVVDLRARVDRLAGDMKRAGAAVSSGAKDIQKQASEIEKYLSQVGATAFKGLAVASTAAAGGLAALTIKGLETVDALAKTADKLGTTTQAVAALGYAANLSGVESGALNSSLVKLQKGLTDAAAGSGSAKKALDALGLEAGDLMKVPVDKQLGIIADKLKGVENPAQKAALATKLFGKAGADLIPLLKDGSAGLAAMAKEAKVLGLDISRIDAAKVEAATDAIDRVKTGISGLGQQLAIKFAPMIQAVADKFFGVAQEAGGMGTVADRVFKALVLAVGVVLDALGGLKGIWALITSAVQQFVGDAARALGGLLDVIGIDVSGFVTSMEAAAQAGRDEVDRIVSSPLPSKQWEDFTIEVERQATAQATAVTTSQGDMQGAMTDTGTVTRALTGDHDKLVTATDAAKASVDKVVLSYAAHAAAANLSELEQKRFNAQLELGPAATDAERLAVDKLVVAAYDAEKSAKAAAGGIDAQTASMVAATKEADPWVKALEGAVERIDTAFSEAWAGSFKSFSDFAGKLKEAFRQMLGELAHMAITRPIVAQIGAAFGLGGASAGAAASGGAGGVGGLMNIGSMFGSLKSAWTGFQSGGLSGAFNGLFGGSATGGSLGNMMSSARFAMGDASRFLGLDSLGARFDSLGLEIKSFGANIVDLGANLGAGFLGSLAGNKLGAALFGERKTTGIGGTVGGFVGSAFGPLGTLVGSFLGSLAENAIGKIFGAGDLVKWGKLGVTTGAAPTDGSGLRTETAASGLSLTAVAKRTDAEAANNLLDAFLALDEGLTAITRSLGVTVDFAGKILGNTSLNVDNEGANDSFGVGARLDEFSTEKIETAAADFVRAWLDQVSDELPQRVRDYMDAQSLNATAEELVNAFQFIGQINNLLSMNVVQDVAAAREAAEAQSQALNVYSQASQRVRELATDFDGSTQSMQALTEALTVQKGVALEIAQAYDQLAGAISKGIGATIEQIQNSLLSSEEIIAQNRAKIGTLMSALGETIDPTAIAALTGQIDELVKSTFGMLTDEQQKAQAAELIGILTQTNDLAQEQIEEGKKQLESSEVALRDAVDESLIAYAENMNTLGTRISENATAGTDRMISAIDVVNASVQAGTSSVVAAITAMSTNVQTAVASAMVPVAAAVSSLSTSLDRQESNQRLDLARP